MSPSRNHFASIRNTCSQSVTHSVLHQQRSIRPREPRAGHKTPATHVLSPPSQAGELEWGVVGLGNMMNAGGAVKSVALSPAGGAGGVRGAAGSVAVRGAGELLMYASHRPAHITVGCAACCGGCCEAAHHAPRLGLGGCASFTCGVGCVGGWCMSTWLGRLSLGPRFVREYKK